MPPPPSFETVSRCQRDAISDRRAALLANSRTALVTAGVVNPQIGHLRERVVSWLEDAAAPA